MKAKQIFALLVATTIFVSVSPSFAKKRMSPKAAKKECMAEDPTLKGKALQKCIKEKRK